MKKLVTAAALATPLLLLAACGSTQTSASSPASSNHSVQPTGPTSSSIHKPGHQYDTGHTFKVGDCLAGDPEEYIISCPTPSNDHGGYYKVLVIIPPQASIDDDSAACRKQSAFLDNPEVQADGGITMGSTDGTVIYCMLSKPVG